VRRRDFMKGLGALAGTLTMTWGGRTVTAEVDRLGDEVIQEGADRGLYSQELADEIINFSSPEGDVTLESDDEFVSESQLGLEPTDVDDIPKLVESPKRADPTDALLRFDWSGMLDGMLDDGVDVHCHGYTMRGGDVINRVIAPQLRVKRPADERVFDAPMKVEQMELDHLYVSFVIPDQYSAMGLKDVMACFFMPSMHEVAGVLNKAAKDRGGELFVAPLPVMASSASFGVKQHLSDRGRIPVRVSMEYDVCNAGHRVTFDLLAVASQ